MKKTKKESIKTEKKVVKKTKKSSEKIKKFDIPVYVSKEPYIPVVMDRKGIFIGFKNICHEILWYRNSNGCGWAAMNSDTVDFQTMENAENMLLKINGNSMLRPYDGRNLVKAEIIKKL